MITRRQVVVTGAALAATASANAQNAKQGEGNIRITRSVHSPPARARLMISLVRSGSTRRSGEAIPRGLVVRSSHSSPARAPHGTRIRWARHSSSQPVTVGCKAKVVRKKKFGPATSSGFRRAKSIALAWRYSRNRHDTFSHFRGARWEDCRLDGAGVRRAVSEMILHLSSRVMFAAPGLVARQCPVRVSATDWSHL
jgi:hypothetical protein